MHIFHLKKKKDSTSLKKYIQLLSNLTHEKESMQTALTNRINKHIPRTRSSCPTPRKKPSFSLTTNLFTNLILLYPKAT